MRVWRVWVVRMVTVWAMFMRSGRPPAKFSLVLPMLRSVAMRKGRCRYALLMIRASGNGFSCSTHLDDG